MSFNVTQVRCFFQKYDFNIYLTPKRRQPDMIFMMKNDGNLKEKNLTRPLSVNRDIFL